MDGAAQDLAHDKAQLLWLLDSAIGRLAQAGEDYGPFSQTRDELERLEFTSAIKKDYGERVRRLYARMATLLSAPNWQSPSFWHTKQSQAGREEGTISASANDYKRDMHADAKQYEHAFVKAYVDHPLRMAPFAYVTSSGMSAVTTALTHLSLSLAQNDVVLAGRSSYFQNKWLLQTLFGTRVQWVDEFNTDEILATAAEYKPKIIFFDSLCGAEALPMPHLKVLIPALAALLGNETTLVLDNTVLATMYQPLADLPWNPLGMKLIVIESLLKFHQFGFDRVSGGILWTPTLVESGLFESRMHMGTILPDVSVLALPEPNRTLFDMRLLRIGRNARVLAEKLHAVVEKGDTILQNVIHPSLPQYRGYAWTEKLPFQGPFVTLAFQHGKRSISHYDAFVSRVQKIAKTKGVDINGGTSFGFDTTRLYITARYATNITEPFVRISLGTETLDELEALADVFIEAIRA